MNGWGCVAGSCESWEKMLLSVEGSVSSFFRVYVRLRVFVLSPVASRRLVYYRSQQPQAKKAKHLNILAQKPSLAQPILVTAVLLSSFPFITMGL
jgi:hypothetical protein